MSRRPRLSASCTRAGLASMCTVARLGVLEVERGVRAPAGVGVRVVLEIRGLGVRKALRARGED
eukprot:9239789-Alexandrium_andersonii.AAC.1